MHKKYFSLIVLPLVIIALIFVIFYSFTKSSTVDDIQAVKLEKKIGIKSFQEPAASQQLAQEQQTEESIAVEDNYPVSSTLAEFAGFGHAIDKDEEQFFKEEHAREELMAVCMESRGFKYTPAPSIVVDEAIINNPEEFERSLAEAMSNPNEVYVNSLSDDMRKSYYLTLTGMEDPNDPEGQAHDLALYSHSCVNKAFEKIPGVYAKRNLLSEPLDVMETGIETDERIALAIEKWSSCMGNQGYSFAKPNDIHRRVDEQIVTSFKEKAGSDKAVFTEDKLKKIINASEQCKQYSQLDKIRQRVRIEFENQFVQDYKKQLLE